MKNQKETRRLNKRTVESLPVPLPIDGKSQRSYYYDDEVPKLCIVVYTSGERSWFWSGWCNGQAIKYRIGSYPEVNPHQARKEATRINAGVAQGIDPRNERWKQRKEMNLGELFASYLEDYAKIHKAEKSWTEDEKCFNRYLKGLRVRAIGSIDRHEVSTLHAKIGKDNGKYAANRMLALLSKMYSFAAELGFGKPNPCKGVRKFREKSRERFLDRDELERFLSALAEERQVFHDYFLILLLTGARRMNVMKMRFDQLKLSEAIWTIPQTKNHDPLTVPLVPEAVEILQRRTEENQGSPWVFPSRYKHGEAHLTEPKTAWARIAKRAELENVRIHDLRRTLGSWQAATGSSLPIIGKSLGHRNQQTTQIYARLDLDPVRESMSKATSEMLKSRKKEDQAEE